MNCPVCNVNLMMTHRDQVEIDYCPKCRGVWLDRGEIDKLIEKAVASGGRGGYDDDDDDDDRRKHYPPPPPQGGYPQNPQGGHYPQKKKKNFLTEIFDWD